MVVLVVQLVLALGLSGGVAFAMGPGYIAIAMLVCAVCGVLLVDADRAHRESAEIEISPLVLLRIGGTAIVLGAIWPSIPIILALHRQEA